MGVLRVWFLGFSFIFGLGLIQQPPLQAGFLGLKTKYLCTQLLRLPSASKRFRLDSIQDDIMDLQARGVHQLEVISKRYKDTPRWPTMISRVNQSRKTLGLRMLGQAKKLMSRQADAPSLVEAANYELELYRLTKTMALSGYEPEDADLTTYSDFLVLYFNSEAYLDDLEFEYDKGGSPTPEVIELRKLKFKPLERAQYMETLLKSRPNPLSKFVEEALSRVLVRVKSRLENKNQATAEEFLVEVLDSDLQLASGRRDLTSFLQGLDFIRGLTQWPLGWRESAGVLKAVVTLLQKPHCTIAIEPEIVAELLSSYGTLLEP